MKEVFSRVPKKSKHKKASDAARKQLEKEAKAASAQKYSFVMDDDDAATVPSKKEKSRTKDKGKGKEETGKRERHSRKRETDGRDWESDEEDVSRKRWKADDDEARGGDAMSEDEKFESPEDEEERRERERLKDQAERDAFAERVRERDKDRTKKVVEDRSTKGAAAEAAARRQLGDDTVARVAAMPSLRERSRQDYLSKRELQQIELLRKEIADDEALFHGMKISKKEKRDLEYKKEVLKLAEERMKIDDRYDGYQLPEDYITEQGKMDRKKKEAVLYQRYEENKSKEDQFVTDVDHWEASQTKHSTFKSGAQDKLEVIDDYEYVFDESQTIQFVMGEAMKGDKKLTPADRILQQQIDEAEKKGVDIF